MLLLSLLAACGTSHTRTEPASPLPPPPLPLPSPVAESLAFAEGKPPRWPLPLPDGETARQVIAVAAPGYEDSSGTVTAYERTAGGWRPVLGPLDARIGYNGFAPPGEKVEGDGRTPSGVFGIEFMFGVEANPGVRFPYRHVTSESIVWDVDPESPTYNTWLDLGEAEGADGEVQSDSPPLDYDYAAAIGYNTARIPGLGSAIFLHSLTEETTIGCVALPVTDLIELLRWLDPAQQPRLVMGVVDS